MIHVLGRPVLASNLAGGTKKRIRTHRDPSMKMPVSEIFCALVVWRFHTAGSGNTSRTKSVRTLGAEPIMKNKGALIQVPWTLLSQVNCTGAALEGADQNHHDTPAAGEDSDDVRKVLEVTEATEYPDVEEKDGEFDDGD